MPPDRHTPPQDRLERVQVLIVFAVCLVSLATTFALTTSAAG